MGAQASGRPVAGPESQTSGERSLTVPVGAALLTLAITVVGSLLTGTRTGAVTGGVESLVTASNVVLGRAADLIPLGYAFGAGMVAAVNPCGFAMLPAYLGLYLGSREPEAQDAATASRLSQAGMVALVVTAGFILLFGASGLLISAGARAVISIAPWIGLTIGVALVLVGAWMLGGGTLHTTLGEQLAARVGDPQETTIKGYFLFGISYGIASLSCTMPVFLTVVGGTIAISGFLGATFQFVMYALGMGFIILILTVAIALFKEAMVSTIRKGLPYVETVSAVLLLVAGAYITYYWLTLGGLLATIVRGTSR